MKNLQILTKSAVVLAIAFAMVANVKADDPDKLPEAIAVLKKHAEATGGAANYKKIKAIKMTGKIEIAAAGIEGTLEVVQVSPDKVATKAEMPQVGSQTQGTNGEIGWDVSTMMGPRILEKNELDRLKEQANLARVYDPKSFYKEMKVVGMEEVEGQKCYKMTLTKMNGDESTEFYAVESGLQVASQNKMQTQMGEIEIKTMLSEYKEVGGIKVPHKIEAQFPNGISQLVVFDKVEVNPEVDEKMFAVPDEIKALMPKDEDKKESDSDK